MLREILSMNDVMKNLKLIYGKGYLKLLILCYFMKNEILKFRIFRRYGIEFFLFSSKFTYFSFIEFNLIVKYH